MHRSRSEHFPAPASRRCARLASRDGARLAFRRCVVLAIALAAAGCEDAVVSRVDGGVGRRLEILDPPGAQIGLRYGGAVELGVRAVLDDDSRAPIADEPVRYAIFDDPAGSTLARDVVHTDGEGVARVMLTAGHQEGSFRVRASATGAADVELSVSTSMLEFVELEVALVDPLSAAGGHSLTALLYADRSCAELGPTPKPEGASRSLTANASVAARLAFVNLLSRTYALVGRVEDQNGLLAFGCVDVERALAPPGAHLLVPVTMRPTSADVRGTFTLTSALDTARRERADGLFAPVDLLDRCPAHLGQLLLDELATRVSPSRAAQIEAKRATTVSSIDGASTVACRPAKLGADDSLDAELDALLEQSGPGAARANLVADLDAILASGSLRSRLSLKASVSRPEDGVGAPQRLLADHLAERVTLGLGAAIRSYDLGQLGLPVLAATGIDAAREHGALALSQHELPIGLPQLWSAAFGELALAARLPALVDTSFDGWITAAAAAAQRNGKTGCAAIEDLLCERTDATACAGTLLAACTDSIAAVGARLDAVFAARTPLELRGSALILDDNGDLIGDRLASGSWREEGTLASDLAWSGERRLP